MSLHSARHPHKRVSVRLVAEGGRQVRAELEGVGAAGSRGFGRLSSEMELANARLGSFARKAGIALAAVTAAAAAAGVAMVRSGLETVGAQADMAASLKTTVASIQTLTWAGELAGVSLGEIEQATKKLTTRLSEAATGSGSAVGALQRLNLTAAALQALPLDQRIVAIQEALNRLIPEAERAAVASDLFGDRAALAFLRIDAQTLRGAAADVQAFGVALSAADAAQIERTGDALDRLTAAVAPGLERVADALAGAARATGPIGQAITGLFDNLGRLAAYAATFAAVMAGRWVAGMAAAALSVRGLATALVFLRGALIRTGIGALIVGAGELVYQFSELVTRVGGVGEAFRLLGDLAREVWLRIGLTLDAALARMAAGWAGLSVGALSALEATIAGVVSFGDRTVAIFQGGYDAAVAIWGGLPGAIGDFAFQAANGLISGVEAMLNGVVARINGFTTALNAALTHLPEWATGKGGVRIGILDPVELARIGNPFEGAATAAGAAAADAFSAALARSYLEPPDLGLGAMADDARARAGGYQEAADMLADAAGRPLASWQALKDAVTGTGEAAETGLRDAASAAAGLGDGMEETGQAAKAAGGATRAAGEAATEAAASAARGWAEVSAALAGYAAEASDWGKGLGEVLRGSFTAAEEALRAFITSGKVDFKGFVQSMLADLAMLSLRQNLLGPLAAALGGALGIGTAALAPVAAAPVAAAAMAPAVMTPTAITAAAIPSLAMTKAPILAPANAFTTNPILTSPPPIAPRARADALSGSTVHAAAMAAARAAERAASASPTPGSGPAGVDVRVFVDQDGNWQAEVERISGSVSARITRAGLDDYDRFVLPGRMARVSSDRRRIG